MKDSAIPWTDHTFNPWIGCAKVSPGCLHCYAETMMDTRYGRAKWGSGNPRVRTGAAYWKQPLAWNRNAANGQRPRVFCGSLCDWLDDEVPIEWLADLLNLIRQTPNLDWLMLTKRPQNFNGRIRSAVDSADERGLTVLADEALDWLRGTGWPNVWIGTTVEDQQRADERIPELLKIPARVRFLIVEPMLGLVGLVVGFDGPQAFPLGRGINWVICGCESGPKRRPMNTAWARSLRDQCKAADVSFFMKQMAIGGRVSDNLNKFPDDLRVREFPKP